MQRAENLLKDSLRVFRELGDEQFALAAGRTLGWVYEELGNREEARAMAEDNLRRSRALGNDEMEATFVGVLATMYAAHEGRIVGALSMLETSTGMWRDLGDRLGVMVDLSRIAGVLAIAGRAETAARVLSRADALREETGAAFEPWNVRMNEETLAAIRAQLDESAISEAWEQGRALTLDEVVMLALESLG